MTSTPLLVLAVGGAGLAAAGAAALVVPPIPRLGPRVRPYTVVARARMRSDADITALAQSSAQARGGTFRRLFAPPLLAFAARVGHLVERRDDDELSLSLAAGRVRRRVAAGLPHPRGHAGSCCSAAAGAVFGIVVLHSTPATLGLALLRCGDRRVARTRAASTARSATAPSGSGSSSTP